MLFRSVDGGVRRAIDDDGARFDHVGHRAGIGDVEVRRRESHHYVTFCQRHYLRAQLPSGAGDDESTDGCAWVSMIDAHNRKVWHADPACADMSTLAASL